MSDPSSRPGGRLGGAITPVSLAALVAFWWVLALLRADPMVLPAPPGVLRLIWAEAQSGALFLHVGATLSRVAAAFALAMAFGTALGLMLGRMRGLAAWIDPWVTVFLNLPALVVIVLCYLWIGLNEAAAIVAVALNKTAMVTVTVREGVRARDRAVDDMAQVFRMGPVARLLHVTLPQLAPYLAVGARNGLAVIWKIVLVVEFLGRPNGVGFQIHLYFQLFETGMVLAYALSFVAVMLAIEFWVIQPIEAATNLWRGETADA